MDYITIPSYDGKYFLAHHEIIRIQSIDNYSKIYRVNARPLVVSKVLLWFEERLPKEFFTRVHRSHLLNRSHITHIRRSHAVLELSNGEKINISRRKKQSVLQSFQQPAI